MFSRAVAVMFLGLALAACQTTPQKANQKEVEKILNRTITETQVQKVEVEKYVNLPDYLIRPCAVTHNKDKSVGEYVRVAIENTANAQACANQIHGIREVQPLQDLLPQK